MNALMKMVKEIMRSVKKLKRENQEYRELDKNLKTEDNEMRQLIIVLQNRME